MASSEEISYMDDDDVSSSSHSSASVVRAAPLHLGCLNTRSLPPRGSSVVSVTSDASTADGEGAMRATLNIVPNIADTSDAESVVDNSLACTDKLPSDSDGKILNNLDRETALKVSDENKYFIPHISDLFYPDKGSKVVASDGSSAAPCSVPEPRGTTSPPQVGTASPTDASKMQFRRISLNPPSYANMCSGEPMGTLDGSSTLSRGESSRRSFGGFPSSENIRSCTGVNRPRGPMQGGPQFDPIPSIFRSDSISSLASEVSTSAGELGPQRRKSSGGLTPTDGAEARTRLRSSKRRRSSLKPRFKSSFADATLQYIRDRLEGRIFSGWLEERQRLENVVKLPSTYTGAAEDAMWRDVVEVDSCDVEMITQLDAVMSSVPGAKDGRKWINIQPPGAVQGYLLWLVLEGEPRLPQHYWFRVVRVSSNPLTGLQLHVSAMRPVGESDAESPSARNRRLAAAAAAAAGDVPLSLSLAWQQLVQTTKTSFTGEVMGQYAALALQPSNVFSAFKMLVFAVVTLVVGTLHCAREAARLFLLFMREAGWLIDRVTPAFQIVVNFVEKMIGGIFILIAMVYKDVRRPNNPPPPPPTFIPSYPERLAIRQPRFVSPAAWRHDEYVKISSKWNEPPVQIVATNTRVAFSDRPS